MAHIKCLLVTICIFISGCVTFTECSNQPILKWPPEASTIKKTISLDYSLRVFWGDVEQTHGANSMNTNMVNKIVSAYRTSELFSSVRDAAVSNEAEIKAVIEENLILYDNWWQALMGFAFGALPSNGRAIYKIKTTYKDMNEDTLGSFEHSCTETTWFWILLFPMIPFNKQPPEMIFDLNRQTILDAHAKGLF